MDWWSHLVSEASFDETGEFDLEGPYVDPFGPRHRWRAKPEPYYNPNIVSIIDALCMEQARKLGYRT